jgi:Ca2+-binding EF-hand superfamily protein
MSGRFFAMLDANHDGVVTPAEMDRIGEQRFHMADTNHDGWLSKGEVLKMRQQMMQRGGGGQ